MLHGEDGFLTDGESSQLADAKAEVLAGLADDFIGLWEVIRAIRHHFTDADVKTTHEMTLKLVQDLLAERSVRAGHPTPDGRGFAAWQLPLDEAVARIEREWNMLGHEPDIGDIVWFDGD